MGMRGFSLKSLKKDGKNTLTYVLSLGISFMLIFTVLNLAYIENSNSSETIELGMIILTIIAIVFFIGCYINDFFMERRAKEVSVALISGSSILKIADSFVFQNIILSIISILIAFGGFLILKPLLSLLLIFLGGGPLAFSLEGSIVAIILILLEIIFITMCNVGLSYRNEICELIQGKKTKKKKKKHFNIIEKIAYIISLFSLAPIVLVILIFSIDKEGYSGIGTIIFIVGFIGATSLSTFVIPSIIEKKFNKLKGDKINIIKFRNLKNSLEESKGVILSYLFIYLAFSNSLFGNFTDKELVARVVLIILLSLILLMVAFIYKFYMSAINREKDFLNLKLLGYEMETIKKIIRGEIIDYFILVFLIPYIQIILVFSGYLKFQIINLSLFLIMITVTILVLILGCYLSFKVYENILLKNLKNSNGE
ncbi:MAG: hypothetical protein ACRDD2_01705 [Sarcina sp.]